MVRSSWLLLVFLLCLTAGCRRPEPSVEAIKHLRDPDPGVREAAARSLRDMAARDAASVGDVGEAYWNAKLASVAVGTTSDKVQEILGVNGQGGEGGGGGSSMHFKLDDHYVVTAFFAEDRATHVDKLQSFSPLVHHPRVVDVVAPAGFNGKWATYFINGGVANESEYVNGSVAHVSDYFANGQLQSATAYVEHKEEGMAVTYFRNGKKATEGRYAAGKRVGPWVEYRENGKPYVEATFVDGQQDGIAIYRREDGTIESRMDYRAGKETGQAAWDEKGKLLYARGSAAPLADAGK
jgi:hypothetical protein